MDHIETLTLLTYKHECIRIPFFCVKGRHIEGNSISEETYATPSLDLNAVKMDGVFCIEKTVAVSSYREIYGIIYKKM